MAAALTLADPLRNDPTSLLLSAWTGFREAELEDLSASRGGALELAEARGGRAFEEPGASLGGLVPPAWVAVDPAGNVFLLDRDGGRIGLADPCECAVFEIPALRAQPLQALGLTEPRAIAASARSLYLVDQATRALAVFGIGEFRLRQLWRPEGDWLPTDVALGPKQRIYVADSLSGSVHVFAKTGAHVGCIVDGRFPGASRLVVDPCGGIYVGVAGEDMVHRLDAAGEPLASVSDPAELVDAFPPLGFRVLPDGSIELHPADASGPCVVSPSLEVSAGAGPSAPVLHRRGRYVSEPLDSAIPDCTWHRIRIEGSVPEGTRVLVRTLTSGFVADDGPVGSGDPRWSHPIVARRLEADEWDGLVLAPPGRFLWLELELVGDGQVTPSLRSIELEFPRISLRRNLPAVFGQESESAEFLDRFLALFDTIHRSVERQVDEQQHWFDLRTAPAGKPDVLGWLASWIGLAADPQWPEARRRAFLRSARDELPRRGTPAALRGVLSSYLGIDAAGRCCEHPAPKRCDPPARPCGRPDLEEAAWQPPALLLEHYRLRRWLFLGAGRLGDQAVVWGESIVNRSQLDATARTNVTQLIGTPDPYRDPFLVSAHAFSVFVPARLVCDARERRRLEKLIREESPAHTRFQLEAVEPRFRIGVQSTIGLDSAVGRYPAGTRLPEAVVGELLLEPDPNERGTASGLRIGVRAQAGVSTHVA